MIKGQKEWRQGNHLRGCFRSRSGGRGGRRTVYTSFRLFQTPGMKCMSEYLKQRVDTSLLVGCTVGESGQKHSFSPKITQAFVAGTGATQTFLAEFSKTGGIYSGRKGGRRGPEVPRRRMERIAGPCYKELRLPYSLRNFCPVISLNIGFSLENTQH